MLDLDANGQGKGGRALWLLLGLAVPLVIWLVGRSRREPEPERRETTPAQPAAPSPALELPVQEPPAQPVEIEIEKPVAVVIAEALPDQEVAEAPAEPAASTRSLAIQVEDAQDVKRPATLLHLDEKRALLHIEHVFAEKEKVRLTVPTPNGESALSLVAVLVETRAAEHEFKLLSLRAGLRERLQNFLSEYSFE